MSKADFPAVNPLNHPMNKFLNLWELTWQREEKSGKYFMASRNKRPVPLSGVAPIPNAVIVAARTMHFGSPRLIVTKEFRLPINDFEVGLVAGLIELGETPEQAAARELFEEANQRVVRITSVSRPLISSAGMSDECFHLMECETDGEPHSRHQEGDEVIEVFPLDFASIVELYEGRGPLAAFPMSGRAWPFLNKIVERGFV